MKTTSLLSLLFICLLSLSGCFVAIDMDKPQPFKVPDVSQKVPLNYDINFRHEFGEENLEFGTARAPLYKVIGPDLVAQLNESGYFSVLEAGQIDEGYSVKVKFFVRRAPNRHTSEMRQGLSAITLGLLPVSQPQEVITDIELYYQGELVGKKHLRNEFESWLSLLLPTAYLMGDSQREFEQEVARQIAAEIIGEIAVHQAE